MPKKKQNPAIPDENKIQKNIQKEKKPKAPPKPRQKKQKQLIDEPKIEQVQEIVPQPVQKPVPKPKPARKRQKKSPSKVGSPIRPIQIEQPLEQNQIQVNKSFQSDKSILNKSFQDPSKSRITFELKRNQDNLNKSFYDELSSVIQKINKPKAQKKTLLQIIEQFQHTPTYLNLKQLEDNFFGQIAFKYKQQANQGKQYISQVKQERFQELPEQEYQCFEEYIPEESDDENPYAVFNTNIQQHIKQTDELLNSTQQRKLFLYKLSKYKIRYDLGLLNRKKKKSRSKKLQEIQIENPYQPPKCVAKIEYLLEVYANAQQDSQDLDDSIGLENSKHCIYRIISTKKQRQCESESESESEDDYQERFKIQIPELKLEYNQLYKKPKIFYDAQKQQIELDMVQDTLLQDRKSSIIKIVQEKIASQKVDDEKSKQLKQLLDNKKIQLNQKRSVLINQAKQSAIEVQEVEVIQEQQKSNQLNKEQQHAQHTQNQFIQQDQQKQIQQDDQKIAQNKQNEKNKAIQKQEKKPQQQIMQINNQIMTQQPIKNNNPILDFDNLRFDDFQPNGSLKNGIERNQKQQIYQNKQVSSPIKRQKNNYAIDFNEQERNKPKNQKEDKEQRENQFVERISSGIFQTNPFLAKCEAISNDKDKKYGIGMEVMSGCEYKKESNRNKISNSKNRYKERTKSDDYPNQKQKYLNLSPGSDRQQREQQKIKPEKQDPKAYESLWIRKPKQQQEGRKSEGSKQEDTFNFILDQFDPDQQIQNNKEVKQLKDYLQNRNSGTWAQESRISEISERKSHFRLFNKDSYNWVIFSSNSIKIGSPFVIKDVTNIDCWQILNIIAPQECFMKYEYFIVSDNFKIFFIEECDIMSFKVYEYIKSGQDQKAAQEVKNLLNNVIKLIYYQHKGQTCLVAYYTTQLFEIIMKDRVFDIFPELQNKLNFMMFRDNQGLQRILLKYLIKVEQITPDYRVSAYDKDFQNKIQFQLGELKNYQTKHELYKKMLNCYQ